MPTPDDSPPCASGHTAPARTPAQTGFGWATWQHDAATGLVHLAAQGWGLLGLPDAPQGVPLADLLARVHPDDRPALLQQARQSADGALLANDLSARCRHASGAWRILQVRCQTQRDAQGRVSGHTGVVLDQTDRFSQQQSTLAMAQRLELATAAAGVGIWSALVDGSEPPHWDEQMRRLHEVGADDVPPLRDAYLARFLHPDDRPAVADSLALLVKRRQGHFDLDMRIVLPGGRIRRLATRTTHGSAAGRAQMHGVMLDVTDRQWAEDRLREAHERSALATRGVGIGTWESEADAQAGWWDEQMFLLRGLQPQPGLVQTADMMQWLHPDDRQPYTQRLQAALAEDGPTNAEFRVVWPDGQVRWLASRSVPVRNAQGRTVRRIGINWDITDARSAALAHEERRLAQRESQAKSRLLARISHELRTPLNAVLGFSALLLADGPDPISWPQRVAHIQASGQHLLALIDDVLELSSLESGELPQQLQPVSLAALVQTCLPQMQLLADSQGVTLHAEPMAAWVMADPARLRQVLLNLLSNAVKYNRPAGQVRLSEASDGQHVVLRVDDTGRGMTAAQVAHLFEPFNRLGREGDGIAGTGIGLAIVRASVQRMGGQVKVSSEPDRGSRFDVLLPRASPLPADAAPGVGVPGLATPALLPRSQRSACVLYIEDNEVNQLIVTALLQQRPDLRLLTAETGQAGVALADAELPDLVLLDMQLPDIDGVEVLRRLRAAPRTAHIACIAVSANAMPGDIAQALAAGFDAYWTKPLDAQAFLQAIDRLFSPAPR